MPMKLPVTLVLPFLLLGSPLGAAPQFWNDPNATPTPPSAPEFQPIEEISASAPGKPTVTPVTAPVVSFPTATPTPEPGLRPLNPTEAAIFSAVVPGSGQVYAGDPLKGLAFAALFGVGLWQTLDNFSLVPDAPGSTNLISKNETLGNLFGLATLAAYGFGIQDAYNSAANYNHRHYLALHFGISPRPNANLAFMF